MSLFRIREREGLRTEAGRVHRLYLENQGGLKPMKQWCVTQKQRWNPSGGFNSKMRIWIIFLHMNTSKFSSHKKPPKQHSVLSNFLPTHSHTFPKGGARPLTTPGAARFSKQSQVLLYLNPRDDFTNVRFGTVMPLTMSPPDRWASSQPSAY